MQFAQGATLSVRAVLYTNLVQQLGSHGNTFAPQNPSEGAAASHWQQTRYTGPQ